MDRFNGTSHVPAFLGKLWRIVDDPSTNDLICWSETGKSFIIRNQNKFARELLPLYYKHNNMASFVRQLNMYGFHKVMSVEQGSLRLDRDEMEFAHPYFVQGSEDALEFIKRKISTAKIEDFKGRPESLNKVLIDVRQMKGRQEAMDSKLVAVKRENEALWRELSQLRQKHVKQQQIVSKLLQFLVSMMSSQSHRISFKRRMPLMLNGVEGHTDSKPAKISRPDTNSSEENMAEGSNGPVIHEVFEAEEPMAVFVIPEDTENGEEEGSVALEGEVNPRLLKVEDILGTAVAETMLSDQVTSPAAIGQVQEPMENVNSPYNDLLSIQTMDSNSESPLPTMKTEDGGSADDMPSLEESMQLSRTQEHSTSNAIVKPNVILPNDLDGHLDDVQVGLESLKDLLQGSAYNVDAQTLAGLFGFDTLENNIPLYELTHDEVNGKKVEKDVPLGITFGPEQTMEHGSGSDLVSYNPCLFELVEDDQFLDPPNDNIFLDDELDMMLTTDRNKLNENASSFS